MSIKNTQQAAAPIAANFAPHVTVATVVERDGRFLLVEEYSHGETVLNQPAGHLEANESLIEAAVRETLEETRWHIQVTAVLNINLYRSPRNGVTYHRTTFVGKALQEEPQRQLDEGIIQPLWLTPDEIDQRHAELRSPLVSLAVKQYLSEPHYPLALIGDCR